MLQPKEKVIVQIKLSLSSCHSILTPGQPVPALALLRQAPGRVAPGVIIIIIIIIMSVFLERLSM